MYVQLIVFCRYRYGIARHTSFSRNRWWILENNKTAILSGVGFQKFRISEILTKVKLNAGKVCVSAALYIL